MKPALRLFAAVLLLCTCLFAQDQPQTVAFPDSLVVEGIPATPASLMADVNRYTEFRSAGLGSWHPTKREMLINTRFADTPQVHRVTTPGGARTQLTFFADRVGGASYQPTTGNYFIFSKDIGGGEWFQYFRYDVATGDVTLLTDGKSRNTGARWNYQGDRIAYSSTRRTGKDNDLYVMNPSDPNSDKLVLQLEGGGWGAADWSPDGKQLLLFEYVSVNESYIWLVDVAAGTKKLLTPKGSADKIAYGGGLFSKDGKGIYVTTDKDSEFQRLAYIDLATGQHTYFTSDIKWDVDEFDMSDDGRTIAFATNEDGVSKLYLFDTRSKKYRAAPGQFPVAVIGSLNWHKNNRDLGFTMVTAKSPNDVYSLDVVTGKIDRWTFSETGGLNTSSFADAELVKWPTFDGKTISGFLYKPPAKFTGKRPVIVNIHGGPEGQSRPGFLGRSNYYLNEMGVAIIFPNVRGSTGYGKTFVKLDNGFQREDSFKDIEALYDWIKTRSDLDPDRVMIMGGSYGGLMVLSLAYRSPDRVRCIVDVVGISNLVTFLEHTEAYRRDLRRAEYGDERDPKMREFMLKIAAMNNVDKMTKPIFIAQGFNDPRVPRAESEQMAAAIRQKGVPVWWMMAKDEGHGFAKKKNQDFQFYSTILFLREYLLK